MPLKPSFLIVGVMKGGTTALYDFICDHPDVGPASQKEIHYFTMHYEKGDDWYLSHFDNPNEAKHITGEASPTYYDLATTDMIPKMIYRHFPQIKIILIVRDPVERAISHYNHLCNVNQIEQIKEMGIERFFNLPYPAAIRGAELKEMLLYNVLNFSCYTTKYRSYKRVFGDNMLVIHNDQLRKSPYETMNKVQQFLGLKNYQNESYKQIKYSSGTALNQLSTETQKKLGDFLYPDYKYFCDEAGIHFDRH